MSISTVKTLLVHQRSLSDVTECVPLVRISQCGLRQQSHVHVHDGRLIKAPLKSTSGPGLGFQTVYPGASRLSAPPHFSLPTATEPLLTCRRRRAQTARLGCSGADASPFRRGVSVQVSSISSCHRRCRRQAAINRTASAAGPTDASLCCGVTGIWTVSAALGIVRAH